MNVFELRDKLVNDYASYTRSFIKIADKFISDKVENELNAGAFWPEPLIQLNPTFYPGGTIDELVKSGTLHKECSKIFRIDKTPSDLLGKTLFLHLHQKEAIEKAKEEKSYVLTSGTGSGKSLTYIVPIVDHVLRNGSGKGIQAIIVYPMNALANSQEEELKKFLEIGYSEGESPVTFARYTGQEKGEKREEIRSNPPDILLTNYMMLELLLTRVEDRDLIKAAHNLKFLVFDELHTYRGRQGADVALLIRRCRSAFNCDNAIHIGTSATMISGSDQEDQKQQVADVAKTFFGVQFEKSQIINESLIRSTPEIDFGIEDNQRLLTELVREKSTPPSNYADFHNHPLSSWIESTFGICTGTDTDRLIRQDPNRLTGKNSASESLSQLTSVDESTCSEILRSFLLKGSELRKDSSSRFPIFAFRLHQFFTRGDTVWSTIEPDDKRYLSLSKMASKPGELKKPLYPLVFCRQCGAAYYRVSVGKDESGNYLLPRESFNVDNSEDITDAYLYISKSDPWPDNLGEEALNRLPAFMKETTPQGVERIKSSSKKDVPEHVYVNDGGRITSEGKGIPAALIHNNFHFCLHTECRIAYTKHQRSERTKLATLGVDNRSTATTIMAVRSLIELQGDQSLNRQARKLLSFTDNRQDASLQAGHFNDFAQVALLRSALYKAAKEKGEIGLNHSELSRSVFQVMQLQFEEYAADPEVRGPARDTTNDALRRVIDYYIYRDLQRGWRVTAPNLEDCGMLEFRYEGLKGSDGLLSETELWEKGLPYRLGRDSEFFADSPETLRDCPIEIREEVILTLLEVMRKSLAVKADVLDPRKQLDLVEQTKPRLLENTVWYLEDTRDLIKAVVAYPRSRKKRDQLGLYLSSYGGYGRYLKRTLNRFVPNGQAFRREDVDDTIRFLFLALKRYGIVEQVRGEEDPGYQINIAALRWLPGSGEVRPADKTRLLELGEIPPDANKYFVECYKRFIDLKCVLEAREHTAQVAAEDRQERETRFRSGELPLLFCSPTMELGVDISQLNLVNLRNVPPTPANYAQRSGRAGRGGQPALVYTYCAGRSPHDQFYYRRPNKMVAGSVAPPKIDICNRDLIQSHVYAIWMEVAKPDLGKTLTSVIDLDNVNDKLKLPIKSTLLSELRNPNHRALTVTKANQLIEGILDDLQNTNWFHEAWIKDILDQVERSFDVACDRWRSLYRSAVRQREIHHKIIGDHSRPEAERNHSKRLRAQAESQIKILTKAEGVYEGDFYSYRYFASEGFLPGYNFPRLPLSAFIPGRRKKGRDEFVSRPRFLAISEFGPRALIYHEGARYRVYKVNLDYGSDDLESTHELVTSIIKRCTQCGYAHLEHGTNHSVKCDHCGAMLDITSKINNLVLLQNVSLKLAQRITCDEEERQRFGYKLVTSYRFPEIAGQLDRKDAEVMNNGARIMQLSYGDSADIFRINLGWTNQGSNQPAGFNLDLERGYWSRNQADIEDKDDAASETRTQRVVPYVKDTKNALIMRFDPQRSISEMASLQSAFKEAIQKHFQLESRELSCEPLPTPHKRNEILYYESSEGGAGVLRQIADDPTVLPELARLALETCHFDPETLEDLGVETCGKACYECLLDYGNQMDHKELDRHLIRDYLKELSISECKPSGGTGSRSERINALRKKCDSKLEERWLDLIDQSLLRPPSDAQFLIKACTTRPDFYYHEHNAAIYIDGPVHDTPDQIKADDEININLLEHGYIVIRFHHKDNWMDIIDQHPDIFGKPK